MQQKWEYMAQALSTVSWPLFKAGSYVTLAEPVPVSWQSVYVDPKVKLIILSRNMLNTAQSIFIRGVPSWNAKRKSEGSLNSLQIWSDRAWRLPNRSSVVRRARPWISIQRHDFRYARGTRPIRSGSSHLTDILICYSQIKFSFHLKCIQV